MAARLCLAAFLLAALAGAARSLRFAPGLRGFESPEAPRALPTEVLRHVLHLVPGALVVAWTTGGQAATLLQTDGARPLAVKEVHAGNIFDVQFFPAGDRLVTVDPFGATAAIWDAHSGRVLHTLRHDAKAKHALFDAQVFPGGDRVATLCSDGSVTIWSASTGKLLQRSNVAGASEHSEVRVIPNSDLLVVGVSGLSQDLAIVWNISRRGPQYSLRSPGEEIRLLEVSPCGTKLVTAGTEQVRVWSVATGAMERELEEARAWMCEVGISSGGARIVGSVFRAVHVWSGRSGEVAFRLPATGPGYPRFALQERLGRVVVVSSSGASIWDLASGRQVLGLDAQPTGPARTVERAQVSPCGRVVAACGSLRTKAPGHEFHWVAVWSAITGQVLHTAEEHDPRGISWLCSVAVGRRPSMGELLLGGA